MFVLGIGVEAADRRYAVAEEPTTMSVLSEFRGAGEIGYFTYMFGQLNCSLRYNLILLREN